MGTGTGKPRSIIPLKPFLTPIYLDGYLYRSLRVRDFAVTGRGTEIKPAGSYTMNLSMTLPLLNKQTLHDNVIHSLEVTCQQVVV